MFCGDIVFYSKPQNQTNFLVAALDSTESCKLFFESKRNLDLVESGDVISFSWFYQSNF